VLYEEKTKKEQDERDYDNNTMLQHYTARIYRRFPSFLTYCLGLTGICALLLRLQRMDVPAFNL
jgi:hypothetical protein